MPAPRLSAADAQSDDDEVPWVPEDSCRQQLDEFWSNDAFGLRKYQVNCHPVEPFSENDPLEGRRLLAQVMKPEPGWGIERQKERKSAFHDDVFDSVKRYEKSSPYCLATCPVTGLTGLHAACLNGYLSLIKAFIELGKQNPLDVAEPLCVYFDGLTEKSRGADALWLCRRRGHKDCVDYLMGIDAVIKSVGQVMQSGQAGRDARAKAEALRRRRFMEQADGMGKRVEVRRDEERQRGLKIKVGSRVKMAKTGAAATVRYVGPVDYASGTFVGLEFDPPDVGGPVYGKHSGIVRGREYFDCPPGMGVMVQPSEVVSEDLPELKPLPRAQTAEISYLCDKKGLKPVAKKVDEEPLQTVTREVSDVEKLSDRQRASFERFKEEEEARRRASLGKD